MLRRLDRDVIGNSVRFGSLQKLGATCSEELRLMLRSVAIELDASETSCSARLTDRSSAMKLGCIQLLLEVGVDRCREWPFDTTVAARSCASSQVRFAVASDDLRASICAGTSEIQNLGRPCQPAWK